MLAVNFWRGGLLFLTAVLRLIVLSAPAQFIFVPAFFAIAVLYSMFLVTACLVLGQSLSAYLKGKDGLVNAALSGSILPIAIVAALGCPVILWYVLVMPFVYAAQSPASNYWEVGITAVVVTVLIATTVWLVDYAKAVLDRGSPAYLLELAHIIRLDGSDPETPTGPPPWPGNGGGEHRTGTGLSFLVWGVILALPAILLEALKVTWLEFALSLLLPAVVRLGRADYGRYLDAPERISRRPPPRSKSREGQVGAGLGSFFCFLFVAQDISQGLPMGAGALSLFALVLAVGLFALPRIFAPLLSPRWYPFRPGLPDNSGSASAPKVLSHAP